MFYLFGLTRSGKGTTMETVNLILGTLSTGVDMETFTSKRYGDTSNFDLAPLKNKRFITASESQRHGQLNPAFVKKVTGGDEIYCSFKRRDHFSYRPQFKIWLTSNFEANTDVDDDAAWGRLRVIHYPKTFLGSEDKTLKKRLQEPESLDAIFAWMVSGAIDWYKQPKRGLPMPEEVAEKTRAHLHALDCVAQFIDQNCVVDADSFTVGAVLYNSYKSWCEDEGYSPFGRKRFTQSLAVRGMDSTVKKVAGTAKRGYSGIGILADEV
jgi:putative DNA primase/helicase